MGKTVVKFGGVPLAANSAITWGFTVGVSPYMTTFEVHRSDFERIERKFNKEQDLVIIDSRGKRTVVKDLIPLHEIPTDSPNRRGFVVADKRWRWQFKLIVRDYNIPAQTGTTTSVYDVPYPGTVSVPQYIFKDYSIQHTDEGTIAWTARAIIEDILKETVGDGGFDLSDFPIDDGELGDLTIQGLNINDSADIALARCLSMMGGVDIYLTPSGKIRALNAADLTAAEKHLKKLPPTRWDGQYPRKINRKSMRPKRVIVYYVRQTEIVWEFDQDLLQSTRANGDLSEPFIENVIPTVDPETTCTIYNDVDDGSPVVVEGVAPGTYIRIQDWLIAMNADRPSGSWFWDFSTLKTQWVAGDLHGTLGARALATSADENISGRVNALITHFRQTFRANRRYMDRIQDMLPIRAGLLDPITGARQPASVWPQGCTVPSEKGLRISSRTDPALSGVYRNENYLRPHLTEGEPLILTSPGPHNVSMINRDAGIFRATWQADPYGNRASWIPSILVGPDGRESYPYRDLASQEDLPMGINLRVSSGANGLYLDSANKMRCIMSIVPGAPNNKTRLQPVVVEPHMVRSAYRDRFAIEAGEGPDLEVFVSPGEATCRYAWGRDDKVCKETIKRLLGTRSTDPSEAGITPFAFLGGPQDPKNDLPGLTMVNWEKEIRPHAIAVAAEVWASHADSVQGRVSTVIPDDEISLQGNMSDATILVTGAPGAKVSLQHGFTGRQRAIPRHAMLDNESRRMLLGIIAFRREV